jgi:hypothetical protein
VPWRLRSGLLMVQLRTARNPSMQMHLARWRVPCYDNCVQFVYRIEYWLRCTHQHTSGPPTRMHGFRHQVVRLPGCRCCNLVVPPDGWFAWGQGQPHGKVRTSNPTEGPGSGGACRSGPRQQHHNTQNCQHQACCRGSGVQALRSVFGHESGIH